MRAIFSFSPRQLLLAMAVFAALALGMALVSQYGFNLHPCHLCLMQRYPYGAIIVLGLLGRFAIKNAQAQKWLAAACIVLLCADGAIAFYHAGVELGIFPGPSGCTSSGKTGQTLEEMRAEIMGAPLVSCDQAMVHVLGLSMAAWNAIAAFAATLVSAINFFKWRKP